MEQQQAAPKREWPKWLWGPDGKRARFDSPADVPVDYSAEKQEPTHRVEASQPSATVPGAMEASPGLIAAIKEQVLAELKAEQREKMAKARAAKGKG